MTRTRSVAIALLLAGVSGCASATQHASSPATSGSPKPLDVAGVKRALARTQLANSGRYELELTTSMTAGSLIVRHVGSYDERGQLAESHMTMTADPAVVKALNVGDFRKLDMRLVRAAGAVYQQMPAWPGAARGKWLRFEGEELSAGLFEADLSGSVLPPLLALLDEAQPTLGGPSTQNSAVIAVPAAPAFLAFPGSSSRKLMARGLDPETLAGDVLLDVGIDDEGRVQSVSVEADTLFDHAYTLAGIPALQELASSVHARITMSDYGTPVRISVPDEADVMSSAEFAARVAQT